MMYRYYPFGMMGGWGWIGLLFWLLLVAAIIVVIVVAVRWSHTRTMHGTPPMAGPAPGPTPGPAPAPDEALEVARLRFAKGEITKEQFDEIVGAIKR